METFDFNPYKTAVFERIDADNGKGSLTDSQFRQLAVENLICKKLNIEVSELDAIVDHYQQRYNIIGSVGKAFYQESACGRQYRHLCLERAILYFEGEELRFMDWLLERQYYTNFPKCCRNILIACAHKTSILPSSQKLPKRYGNNCKVIHRKQQYRASLLTK
ncbi:MAG: hypothetical protein PHR92_14670 [Lachnospiraceae bacterium]|nr:hypothetical protein [Lachnospiraceae bacterium]